MSSFNLRITSSIGDFYIGQCESLVIPTIEGEYGILAHHESIVIGICVGELRFKVDGEWRNIYVGQGYCRFVENSIYVIVDSAERPEDIDLNRALAAKRRAEERLSIKMGRREYYKGKLAISRAMARIKIKEKKFM